MEVKKFKFGYQYAQHDKEINFGEKFYKAKKFPYFGYKDDCGNRHRIIDGKDFVVLTAGAIWLYSQGYFNLVYYDEVKGGAFKKPNPNGQKIQKYAGFKDPFIYYSLSKDAIPKILKGCDNKPNNKVSEALFSNDAEVSNQYLADTKKNYSLIFDDSYQNNIERVIYYVEQYNKKNDQ